MPARVRPVEYFYAIVEDKPGEAYNFLKQMASAEINLLAFNAIPLGMEKTELVLFPEPPVRVSVPSQSIGRTSGALSNWPPTPSSGSGLRRPAPGIAPATPLL